MLFPGTQEEGESQTGAEVDELKPEAFKKSQIKKLAKLHISQIGFWRGDKVDFRLFAYVAIGKDKKYKWEKVVALSDEEGDDRACQSQEIFFGYTKGD